MRVVAQIRPFVIINAICCALLNACARPVEIRHERVEVPVVTRVPIPAELTEPMPDCVPPSDSAWIDIAITLAECQETVRLGNRRLAKIAEIGGAD